MHLARFPLPCFRCEFQVRAGFSSEGIASWRAQSFIAVSPEQIVRHDGRQVRRRKERLTAVSRWNRQSTQRRKVRVLSRLSDGLHICTPKESKQRYLEASPRGAALPSGTMGASHYRFPVNIEGHSMNRSIIIISIIIDCLENDVLQFHFLQTETGIRPLQQRFLKSPKAC